MRALSRLYLLTCVLSVAQAAILQVNKRASLMPDGDLSRPPQSMFVMGTDYGLLQGIRAANRSIVCHLPSDFRAFHRRTQPITDVNDPDFACGKEIVHKDDFVIGI